MIGHDDKRASIVMPKSNTAVQRVYDEAGNGRLARRQTQVSAPRGAVAPSKKS